MPSRAILVRFAPWVVGLLASCGPPRGSTVSYAGLRETWRAEFFVVDHTVVVRSVNPPGLALVVWAPRVEQGDVVFNAGVASAGSGGLHLQCFRVDALSLVGDWRDRLYWREPDGQRAHITASCDSDEAMRVASRCPVTLTNTTSVQ